MRRLLLLCLSLSLSLVVSADSADTPAPRRMDLPDVPASDGKLPSVEEMERLARTDPVAFVEHCIGRYNAEVKGYRCTLKKQERINGQLGRSNLIDVSFREEPFSVLMRWKEGADAAQAVLYNKGENKRKLLALPTGFLARVGPVERDVNGADAKKNSRYLIDEFGIKIAMQRTLLAWRDAQKQKALHVEYLGRKRIKELDNRLCFVLRRGDYARPEEGITSATFYFDTETWLQTGSTLKGEENKLIGEYFFRDMQLNPKFPADTFTRAGLAAGK